MYKKNALSMPPLSSKLEHTVPQVSSTFEKLIAYCFCIGLVLLVPLDWGADFWNWSTVNRQIMRGFLLGIMFLYVLKTGIYFGAKGFKTGRVLTLIAVITGLYAMFESTPMSGMYYYSKILFWLVGSVAVYRWTLSGAITHKIIIITIGCLIFISSLLTIYHIFNPTEIGLTQNTRTYTILWCIPFLLLEKRTKITTIMVAVASVAILLAIKRGAVFALLLSLCTYIISYAKIHSDFRNFLKTMVFALILGLTITCVVYSQWDKVLARTKDLSDSERIGSGRGGMYHLLVKHWSDADMSHIILGFGSRSVQRLMSTYGYYLHRGFSSPSAQRLTIACRKKSFEDANYGGYAHSDWLQFLHDYGLLGIVALGSLHFTILSMIRKGFQRGHPYTPALVMGYTILFLVNIYSGHLVSPLGIYFGVLIGFISAKFKMEHSKICQA